MPKITFMRLPQIAPTDIQSHMNSPRVAEHLPLLSDRWDLDQVARFVGAKENRWHVDGLGHWAILYDGQYVGWGGFQKEGDEWDYGLVLKPDAFGLGTRITRHALDFARADTRIPFVTFLLPPSRQNLAALKKIGACYVGDVSYDGAPFRKFRLNTE